MWRHGPSGGGGGVNISGVHISEGGDVMWRQVIKGWGGGEGCTWKGG